MNRRGFLSGILAAGVAPAFIGSSILMPVRQIFVPDAQLLQAMTQSLLDAADLAANPPLKLADIRLAIDRLAVNEAAHWSGRFLLVNQAPQSNGVWLAEAGKWA